MHNEDRNIEKSQQCFTLIATLLKAWYPPTAGSCCHGNLNVPSSERLKIEIINALDSSLPYHYSRAQGNCIFCVILFLNYILLIMLLQLSQFFSLAPLHAGPATP